MICMRFELHLVSIVEVEIVVFPDASGRTPLNHFCWVAYVWILIIIQYTFYIFFSILISVKKVKTCEFKDEYY